MVVAAVVEKEVVAEVEEMQEVAMVESVATWMAVAVMVGILGVVTAAVTVAEGEQASVMVQPLLPH